MPKRPTLIWPANPNKNTTEKLIGLSNYLDADVAKGEEMSPTRLAIVDSGCSGDTHPVDLALKMFPKKIRKLIKAIVFETATEHVSCSQGARVQFGPWDVALDVSLSPGSPSLISIGQCLMEASMSLFWLAGKHPFFITSD